MSLQILRLLGAITYSELQLLQIGSAAKCFLIPSSATYIPALVHCDQTWPVPFLE